MARWTTVFLALLSLASSRTAGGAAPATAPAATTAGAAARPDPHLWARRNVDLIREAASREAEPHSGDDVATALGFSLGFNPLLVRDPYAGDIVKILEARLNEPVADEKIRASMRTAMEWLRLPEEQRIIRQIFRGGADDAKPLVRPGNEYNVTSEILRAPRGEPYDTIVRRTIEEMDAAARQAGEWDGLALAYSRLADRALEVHDRDRANGYIDHMLAILREHPGFQDPNRGNTDAVSPAGVATLLQKAGREKELEALIEATEGQHRIDMLLGLASRRIDDGEMEEARRLVESRLRVLSAGTADRIIAAMDGNVLRKVAATTTSTATTAHAERKAARDVGRADMWLTTILIKIADAHARVGDVETAARLLAEHGGHFPHIAEDGELTESAWSNLARLAGQGGHAQAAKTAFERAIAAEAKEKLHEPAELEERDRLVREAVELGQYDLAYRQLSTTSAPGASMRHRLAVVHRRRGNHARADALIEEAIAIGLKGDGGGNVLAAIAADLHAAGQIERAEELLTKAIDHIEGVDFGFSGLAAIVHAAMRMNRLDLLDRLYASYRPGAKMLLCIMATRAGLAPAGPIVDE